MGIAELTGQMRRARYSDLTTDLPDVIRGLHLLADAENPGSHREEIHSALAYAYSKAMLFAYQYGYLDLARAWLLHGDKQRASTSLERARAVAPELTRNHPKCTKPSARLPTLVAAPIISRASRTGRKSRCDHTSCDTAKRSHLPVGPGARPCHTPRLVFLLVIDMTDEQFDAVLRGFAADFGSWSRDDVVAACAASGWVVTADDDLEIPEWSYGGYLSEHGTEYLPADPAFSEIGTYVATIEPRRIRAYIDAATKVWGSPSFHGGNFGVFVCWRGKDTSRALELDHRGRVSARVFATYAWDSWTDREWEYGTGLDEVPFTWFGELDTADMGMVGFGWSRHLAETWDGLAEALTRTLRDLRLGMVALGNRLTDNDGPLTDSLVITLEAANATDDDNRLVQILLSLEDPGIHVRYDDKWRDLIVEHGLEQQEPGWGLYQREVSTGDDGPAELSSLAVTFLRAFGLELDDVRERSWRYNDPYDYFAVTCVGVQQSRTR